MLGNDMIINTPLIIDCEYIRICKKYLINKNNQNKNKNHKPLIYRVCEKLLVRDKKANKNLRVRTKSPSQLPRFVQV